MTKRTINIILLMAVFTIGSFYMFHITNQYDVLINDLPTNPEKITEWNNRGEYYTHMQYTKAKKVFDAKLRKQQQSTVRDAGINQWTDLGPTGIGGRVRAFAVNPIDGDQIILGATTGGIWKTLDKGDSWYNIDDLMENIAISDIIYHPTISTTVFASTSEVYSQTKGNLIFKSTNNGESWTALPLLPVSPSINYYINQIVIDSNNPDWIYAGISTTQNIQSTSPSGGRLYRSQDGGNTWNDIGSSLASSILDIEIDPFDSNNILIGTINSIFRITNALDNDPTVMSINGFDPGQIPNNIGRTEISYCESDQDIVYALCQGGIEPAPALMYRSSNGGDTWIEIDISDIEGSLAVREWNNLLWVDPTNSDRVIIGGVNLYRTVDEGANFEKITNTSNDIGEINGDNNSIHADNHMIQPFSNYDGNTNNGVFVANDGGLYSAGNIWTVTEGSGWKSNVGNLRITQCYSGAVSPDGKTLIVGTQDNSFNISTDGGASWTQPLGGDGGFAAINYDNDNIIYANRNFNKIGKSTNGGINFPTQAVFGYFGDTDDTPPSNWPGCATGSSCVENGIFYADDNANLISGIYMNPTNPNVILAGAKNLWRNNAALDANSWTKIKENPFASGNIKVSDVAMDSEGLKTIWASFSSHITRSLDDGINWTGNLSPFTTPITAPSTTDIAINPNDSDKVMVSFTGYNNNNIYYTENANDASPTWQNISMTDIEMQVNVLTWHPENDQWIYAGTDLGIFSSENMGQTWSITPLYSENEGPINAQITDMFWQKNTTNLHVTTYARGIWRSNTIMDKIYVDKTFNGTELGTFDNPFKTFMSAYNAAGNGSEIIFLTGGHYDELSSALLIKKRLTISGINLSESAKIH